VNHFLSILVLFIAASAFDSTACGEPVRVAMAFHQSPRPGVLKGVDPLGQPTEVDLNSAFADHAPLFCSWLLAEGADPYTQGMALIRSHGDQTQVESVVIRISEFETLALQANPDRWNRWTVLFDPRQSVPWPYFKSRSYFELAAGPLDPYLKEFFRVAIDILDGGVDLGFSASQKQQQFVITGARRGLKIRPDSVLMQLNHSRFPSSANYIRSEFGLIRGELRHGGQGLTLVTDHGEVFRVHTRTWTDLEAQFLSHSGATFNSRIQELLHHKVIAQGFVDNSQDLTLFEGLYPQHFLVKENDSLTTF
jgi:hypothetical protein